MKLLWIGILVMLGLNSCSSHVDKGYYERANKANEKALERLDKE